jgi:anaerobic magnesium-protoporphyrin IX monomethyl ester cyclase
MRIALINPPPPQRTERWDRADYPHIGLGYVAAALQAAGRCVSVVDGKLERVTRDGVIERMRVLKPQIVGLTAMTHEIGITADLARMLREALPAAHIVVGGVHPTALPGETLRDCAVFDTAVSGEGERSLVELCAALEGRDDLGGITGLAWRRGDEIVVNPPRAWMSGEELDTLPFPAWALFPRARAYPVLTTRGCPFKCVFCARPYGRQVRARAVENVLAEFRWLREDFAPGYIKIYDETFGVDRRRADALLEGLSAFRATQKLRWSAHARISTTDEALLDKMAHAGCDYVGFGIESGNAELRKLAAKDVDLDKALLLVRAARRLGVRTEGFYIIGMPNETRATAWETIRAAARLRTDFISLGIMVPYPGTGIWDMARRGEGGYRLLSSNWRDFNKQIGNALELEALSRSDMERLQLIGYTYFFLRNLRLIDFARFCWTNRIEGVSFLRHFMRRHLRRKTTRKAVSNGAQAPVRDERGG